MKKLAIIIPVFNGLNYTKKCITYLKSLLDDKKIGLMISLVVIDDGSTDGTSEWLKKEHPEVQIVKGDGTLWWSGGINKGVNFAIETLSADYILWWNNDITPEKNYFIRLSGKLKNLDDNVILGSKVYCEGNSDIVWSMGGRFNSRTGKRHMYGYMQKDGEQFNKVTEADWLPGMGTIISTRAVAKIGMLDEKNFPQYHGDSDYTLRAKNMGYKILVDPELKIWNDIENSGLLHGKTFKGLISSFSSVKSKYNLRKDLLFFKRFAKSPVAYFFLFREYFKYVAGFLKWKFLSLFSISKEKA